MRGAAILLALGLLIGCQRAPSATLPVTDPTIDVAKLRAEGDARRGREDFAGALDMYRIVLQHTPNDVRLHYLTGVTLTELHRRDEAATEFRWVVEHGAEDREEVALARQWLAGSAPGRPAARPAVSDAAAAARNADPNTGGRVVGKTEWKNLDPERPAPRLQLVLMGTDGSSKSRRFAMVVELNQPYQFVGVPPGDYRLVGQVGMKRLWDVRVSVQEGKTATLDLTEAGSQARPDALRARAS